jgi:hypothetical protein
MKVIFCIPTHDGKLESECHSSLVATYAVLREKGIEHDEFMIKGCPYLPVARNTLVAMFMNDPDATDLFFIDSDLSFDPMGVFKILDRPEGIVAGAYPLKRYPNEFPVKMKREEGYLVGIDDLLEAELMPTGFMRIKRRAFEIMQEKYPELKYTLNHVNIDIEVKEAYDFFQTESAGSKWTTEDYAFCNKWTAIGGKLFLYPNVQFSHIGRHLYSGNYHEYLLQVKKLSEANNEIQSEKDEPVSSE